MTPGTVYTVIRTTARSLPASSRRSERPTIAALGASDPDLELPPGRYSRVAALAGEIVRAARATTTYAKVNALETWMSTHLRYSTDIPPLLAGQDAVNQFLFGSRVGYCEQISTALAVMLRTLGVPTERHRLRAWPFDPLSDLYEIQAKDAHSWVQCGSPESGGRTSIRQRMCRSRRRTQALFCSLTSAMR